MANNMKKNDVYAVVDLETTNNQRQVGRIIQIAVVFVRQNEIVNQFSTLVNPGQPIPTEIQKLTHINEKMVREAPYFEEVAPILHAMLEDTVIVAHNVNFDWPFLNTEFERVGMSPMDNEAVDTVTLSQILWPTLDSYRLPELTKQLGIAHENPHRADSDARATGALLILAMQKAEALPMMTLQQLEALPLVLPQQTKIIFSLALQENQAHPKPLAEHLMIIDHLALRRFNQPTPINPKSVIPPFPKKERSKQQLFADQLEYRENQVKLMNQVYEHYTTLEATDTFVPGEQAMVVEAPTGMGKTLGYLLPLAYLARQHQRQVVISTPTKVLQRQVLTTIETTLKDLLPFEVRGVQLKGHDNFLNLQSFRRSLDRDDGSVSLQFMKAQVLVWLTETLTGDLDELNLNNVSFEFLQKLTQTANNPHASKFETFEFNQRQVILAQQATFLVVNHSYLTQALHGEEAFDRRPYLVVDEAQHLPEVVLNKSQKHVDLGRWQQQVHQAGILLNNQREPSIQPVMQRLRAEGKLQPKFNAAFDKLAQLLQRLQQRLYRHFVMNHHAMATTGQQNFAIQAADLAQFMLDYDADLAQIWQLNQSIQNLLEQMMEQFVTSQERFNIDERQNLADFRHVLMQLNRQVEQFRQFQNNLADYAEISTFWITESFNNNENTLQLNGGLVETEDYFKQQLYPYFQPPLMVGATLFNSAKSNYLYHGLALSRATAEVEKFPEVFDYKNQAELIMLTDAPAPTKAEYVDYLQQQLLQLLVIEPRNTLVLFTSAELMQRVFTWFQQQSAYRNSPMTILAQGISGTRTKLIKRLQKESKLMIFGLLSFWEGVDLPGNQVEMVVLTRLPFEQPQALATYNTPRLGEASNEHDFYQKQLPKAILRLRQGVGRLVRSKTDRGMIIIFDSRIVHKQYGKAMQKMLPAALPKLELKTTDLSAQVQNFFKKQTD